MKKDKKGHKKYTMIGGQALLEGVMMRGKKSMAMAVRTEDGDILLETERIKPKKKWTKFPLIRGVIAFINSLFMGVSVITRSTEAGGVEEDEKLGKFGMAIAVLLGVAMALLFFFFIPGLLAGLFYDHIFENILVKNLVSGVLRILIFVGYLLIVSLMKDIRRTFMYHGAEHRTINCFEAGLPLTVENVQKCSTRHNRCGTTFMFLVMIISILVFAFLDVGLTEFIPMSKGLPRTLAFMGIKFLFLPLVAGISYEILFLFAKLPDGFFTTILRAPGLALQRLTTKIPDDKMAEVAIVSFNAVLNLEADDTIKTVKFAEFPIEKVRDIISKGLAATGAEEVEGEWMLCQVTGKKRGELAALKHLSPQQVHKLHKLLEARKTQPLDYALGKSCFFGFDIEVDNRVLIPRPETEILTAKAIELCFSGAEVLDMCTGSGCIALVLSKKTQAKITASDISEDALGVAEGNLSEDCNVELLRSDLFSQLEDRKFDLIVSNPPYIKSGDIDGLDRDVTSQPRIALDGGEDGLDIYRRIAQDAPNHLKAGGKLLLEVGFDQAKEVCVLLEDKGFKTEIFKDLEGVDRIVLGWL